MKIGSTVGFLGLAALSMLPGADAQVPAGGEFLVNTYTTGVQEPFFLGRATASAPNGDFVAVWTSDPQDGSGAGVFGQRFDSAGVARGAEFRANAHTTGVQMSPTVAVGARGDFVVAWQSAAQDGDGEGIFAQRYSATGQAMGAEFRVNSVTAGNQRLPAAAIDGAGNFTIVWSGGVANEDVFGQRFDATGNRRGAEFRLNTYTTGTQGMPSVDVDGSANAVVAWESFGQVSGAPEVFAQRVDASGNPLGAEFQVSNLGSGYRARVAVAGGGDFVVVWNGSGAFDGVFGRRFDAAGTALGPAFQVNTYTTGVQYKAEVATDEIGNFIVTWTNDQAGNADIFAKRYDSSGTVRGPEFQVNTQPFGLYPGLASDAVGNFVVTWTGDDGSVLGVFGRRFGGLQPTALSVDAVAGPSSNGNGVLEAGESVAVAPSWRNVNGAAQTFTGAASAFTGPGTPGNPTYAITDAAAGYGAVANGATTSCATIADCYGASVSSPTVRPATHWDATLVEDIVPAAHGQAKRWALHVGDSFTDVPRSSPFYRFIETLLHSGVTAGCGATQYCPASATSREQMAVFVLVAKEGVGYAPAACGATPAFADVPVTSAFCRWIEELARRGVVGGCGGGNYCPASPVSREQMAVFTLLTLDPAINPPACAPPNVYADVPETSPFCRWIEELTARGVVSGCGGGNYCPAAPVTREQMGVFLGVTFGLQLYGP